MYIMKNNIKKGGKEMSCGKCCANCVYAEYSPSWDKHLGKRGEYSCNGESDWYCTYWDKWLGTGAGSCGQFKEK